MRLFVAAELDDTVRTLAADVTSTLRAAADADGRRSVNWVATANLHFTLQFIGDVEPPTVRGVVDRLSPPFEVPAFDVAIGGVGTFPASGPPRVVWLGVTDGGVQLAALARAVNRRLDAIGLPREDRPFRAHLTLGRVKGPVGPRLRDALAAARDTAAGRCRITRVTLFESRLSPYGSTYAVVTTLALG
jgi:RNA 2',3'-cyclic 3'-phosphodiesterase